MMFWSMVYALVVAVLGVMLAALAERLCRAFGRSGRWVWLAALVLTIVLSVTRVFTEFVAFETIAALEIRRAAVAASAGPLAAAVALVAPLDGVLITAWWCSVIAAGAVAFFAWRAMERRKLRWAGVRMGGEHVLVATDAGPAIVGFLRGVIVVPSWLGTMPPDQRDLVLAHEREHLRAADHRVWFAALSLGLLMPWNPALWWHLRRLRRAIEVDCDRRVLASRPGAGPRYARTLLDVSERAATGGAALSFLDEYGLESRVRQLVWSPATSRAAAAIFALGVLVVLGALMSMPNPVLLGCAARRSLVVHVDGPHPLKLAHRTLRRSASCAASRQLPRPPSVDRNQVSPSFAKRTARSGAAPPPVQ